MPKADDSMRISSAFFEYYRPIVVIVVYTIVSSSLWQLLTTKTRHSSDGRLPYGQVLLREPVVLGAY